VLQTGQKGAIAESAIAHEAIKLGVEVWVPLAVSRSDLLFDIGERFLRVQCKWASRYGEIVVVRCYSARRTRDGLRRRTYSSDEVDLIGAYCDELDRCYLLPPELFSGRNQIHLRLSPGKNNQKLGVKWADEFEMAGTLERLKGP
jgi:hypothetical protein